jgi:hypothetical protein
MLRFEAQPARAVMVKALSAAWIKTQLCAFLTPTTRPTLSPHWAGEFPLDAYIAVSPGSEAALASITPRDSSLLMGSVQ